MKTYDVLQSRLFRLIRKQAGVSKDDKAKSAVETALLGAIQSQAVVTSGKSPQAKKPSGKKDGKPRKHKRKRKHK